MRVLAHRAALRHRLDHRPPEVLGVRRREADALDAVDGVARPQQRAELGAELAAPGVDVLAEQRDLAHALRREPFHLGEDLARPPRHLAPANRRDDAVRALRVAAHRDLHPRLKAPLTVHRQRRREATLLRDSERAARDSEPARAEPVAEMRDRARPERDVDLGVEGEKALALGLCVAPADGDHRLGTPTLLRDRVTDVRGELRVRLLADRAGVEHDHVGRFARRRLPESELLQHPFDPFAVVSVHLAAEGRHEVAAHGQNRSRGSPELFGSGGLRSGVDRAAVGSGAAVLYVVAQSAEHGWSAGLASVAGFRGSPTCVDGRFSDRRVGDALHRA